MLITLVSLAFCLQLAPQTTAPPPDLRCGSYCLFVALKAMGAEISSLESLESKLGERGPLGYSMLQLQETAEHFKCYTTTASTTIDMLRFRHYRLNEDFVCITVINDSHFVCLYDVSDTSIKIADPPKLYELDSITMEKAWSKNVLLLSKLPISSEESAIRWRRIYFAIQVGLYITVLGLILFLVSVCIRLIVLRKFRVLSNINTSIFALCTLLSGCSVDDRSSPEGSNSGAIVAEPQMHELGTLIKGQSPTIEVTTKIKNIGQGSLDLGEVSASCECTSARLGKRRLSTGEETELITTIRVGDVAGPRSTRIQLLSSDLKKPRLEIGFAWEADNPISLPEFSINTPPIRPNQPFSQSIPVTIRYIGMCAQCQVLATSSSPKLSTEWVGSSRSPSGHIDQIIRNDPGFIAGKFNINIQPSIEPLRHSETVAIELRCKETIRARLVLPIAWTIEPLIQASPQRLFAGTEKGNTSRRFTVFLQTRSGKPLEILSVTASNNLNIKYYSEPTKGQLAFVTIEVFFPVTRGPWRETITLKTNQAESKDLTVPISGITE